MSVGYQLVNITKHELISFRHLPVEKKSEICSNNTASKLVTLYLIENIGDEISFFPDQFKSEEWNLRVSISEIMSYKDVTSSYIDKAEHEGFLSNREKVVIDEDDPELFYWRFDSD